MSDVVSPVSRNLSGNPTSVESRTEKEEEKKRVKTKQGKDGLKRQSVKQLKKILIRLKFGEITIVKTVLVDSAKTASQRKKNLNAAAGLCIDFC